MTDRLRCPGCGLPTIEDSQENMTKEEMMCDTCHKKFFPEEIQIYWSLGCTWFGIKPNFHDDNAYCPFCDRICDNMDKKDWDESQEVYLVRHPGERDFCNWMTEGQCFKNEEIARDVFVRRLNANSNKSL